MVEALNSEAFRAGSTTLAATVRIADGPTSDAAMADMGSAVLRQEHDFDFEGLTVWCIGHIAPSSCAQVHWAADALGIPTQSTIGADTNDESWTTSHAPTSRRVQRWPRIDPQPNTGV